MTGIYTGRSPKDKYIVEDENSKDTVWWTSDEYKNDNHPATQEAWDACLLYTSASAGTVKFPKSVWNELQFGICFLYSCIDSDFDFLCHLSEANIKWCGKWCRKIV